MDPQTIHALMAAMRQMRIPFEMTDYPRYHATLGINSALRRSMFDPVGLDAFSGGLYESMGGQMDTRSGVGMQRVHPVNGIIEHIANMMQQANARNRK